MRHPDEYRLERWLAALFSLLFLLPAVAQAQSTAPGTPTLPVCQADVAAGSPILEREPDVKPGVQVSELEPIRVFTLERRQPCSRRF